MRVILLLFLTTLNMVGVAQNYFNNNYEYHSKVANATAIVETDSGYIFTSCIYASGYNSFLIVQIGLNGDTAWTKEYQDTLHSFSTGTSNSIIKTSDSNYVFCGSRLDATNNRDAWLVKFDPNGDTLWTRSYGGGSFDNANVVCQAPDTGFVLMGTTKSFSAGPASDFYLIKTDKNGIQQWQQVYGTTASEDCVSGQITLDGGFILSGRKSNMFHIVKTDANGGFQWQQTYSGTIDVCFIKQLTDSSYILTGSKTVTGLGFQACILKVNSSGALIWQKTYGGNLDDWFYSQAVTLNDGSIITAGQSISGSIPIGLLVKTDSLGNLQWLRKYFKNPIGDNYFYDVKSTSDNGFIMSGFALVATSDPWVVKVDEFGCEVANCSVGVNEFQISNSKLILYPNPANNEITLQISDLNISDAEIQVINGLGEFQQFQISDSKINISNFNAGVYFMVVTFKDGQRLTEKFLKQ